MLSPIINNWEKYEELNTKLAKVLEEQEKNPTVSGYEAICGICKELETLNKIHKKKVELMEDFEDEDGFIKLCNDFKVPDIPEFKPYIP